MKTYLNKPAFSTKARTLSSLFEELSNAQVLPLEWFTKAAWQANHKKLLDQLLLKFGEVPLVARSSAVYEDSVASSLAGHFATVLGVQGRGPLKTAIQKVINSYGKKPHPEDEVLVQPMLSKVRLSGVAFSKDPGTGAPYRVINYAVGEDTTAVTGGTKQTKTFVSVDGICGLPPDMEKIVALIKELEGIFPEQTLDIEFAFAEPDDTLYLLQVRPLTMRKNVTDAKTHRNLLERVATKIKTAQQPHPFLHGRSTIFGTMPDWNPAEIIGVRPRPLALSLYRELITDTIWAYQRNNYGYRNLRSFPLIVHFAGQPYVDIRLSFNSFIPKNIEGNLADKLVDYYIDQLTAAPTLHDKVEFEIVFSCYTLDLPERLRTLENFGFNKNDQKILTDNLRLLTNRIIDEKDGLWRMDEAKLSILSERREKLLASSLDPISRIYWLLEDCKRYGTLPFAGLARAGFIAVQMLNSLVTVGVFSQDDYDCFMNSLNTVSGQLAWDLSSIDKSSFLARYGHLRPGTYDILSPRYDEAPNDYFKNQPTSAYSKKILKPFVLSTDQRSKVSRLLEEHGLSCDVDGLFEFLQAGIELREYAKFVFTRNLSDAISLFREWGGRFGFSPDELSCSNIGCIRELYAGTDDPKTVLNNAIEEGMERYKETCSLWLPPLITQLEDVSAFHIPDSEPNFVTQASVTGLVVRPENQDNLAGGIVFIPSADPGFDWLFAHPIAGLVTAYGGVNSHMAIRSNERGLPAVIGAGEALFKQWSQARRIHIDCAGRRVELLS